MTTGTPTSYLGLAIDGSNEGEKYVHGGIHNNYECVSEVTWDVFEDGTFAITINSREQYTDFWTDAADRDSIYNQWLCVIIFAYWTIIALAGWLGW